MIALETKMPQEKKFTVVIDEYENGFIATSRDMEGLYVSFKTFEGLLERIPVAIRLLMKATTDRNYQVTEIRPDAVCRPRPLSPTRYFEAKLAA